MQWPSTEAETSELNRIWEEGRKERAKLKYRAVCAVCHCSPLGKSNASTINHASTATSDKSPLENKSAGGGNHRCLWDSRFHRLTRCYPDTQMHECFCRCTQFLSSVSLLAHTHTRTSCQMQLCGYAPTQRHRRTPLQFYISTSKSSKLSMMC